MGRVNLTRIMPDGTVVKRAPRPPQRPRQR